MRAGIGVAEFWSMTPREAMMAIEASWWRWAREQRRMAWQAWTIANLTRAKRLPSLASVLDVKREFTPEELAERKARHAELAAMVSRPEIQDQLQQFMERRRGRQRKAGGRQYPNPSRAGSAR